MAVRVRFLGKALIAVFLSFVSCCAMAWQSANVQLLQGSQYELGDSQRTIVTGEYAHSGGYGDFFGFVDHIKPNEGASTYYAELSPRFSWNKLTGHSVAVGPLKDISLAFTVEVPKQKTERYLYGIGTDWAVPGFRFFKLNFYVRDNPDLIGTTEQLTVVWLRPFTIGNSHWLCEGFIDLAGREGDAVSNLMAVPRLLADIGRPLGLPSDKLWLGVEYSYWRNKFGKDGINESVPQAQVKWVF